MIDRGHELPIAKQAQALGISRGSVYYLPRPVPAGDLAVMRRMDELHLEFPKRLCLLCDRQIVLPVDHRFALSRPALPSAPDKKSLVSVSSPIFA